MHDDRYCFHAIKISERRFTEDTIAIDALIVALQLYLPGACTSVWGIFFSTIHISH